MLEKDLQKSVLELAHLRGWRTYHTYDARRSTPGFPDLSMVRGKRLIFAELKREKGRLTAAQTEWIEALRQTVCEVYVWRPADWQDGTIEDCLL